MKETTLFCIIANVLCLLLNIYLKLWYLIPINIFALGLIIYDLNLEYKLTKLNKRYKELKTKIIIKEE